MTMRPEPYLHLDDESVHRGIERLGEPAATAPRSRSRGSSIRPSRPQSWARAGRSTWNRRSRRASSTCPRASANEIASLFVVVLVLNQEEVERLLDMEGCIEAMEGARSARPRRGGHAAPLRVQPAGSPSLIGLMPAHRGGDTRCTR